MASLNGRATAPRRIRSERGAEIIELAIVTPLFLLLIAAMFDFGFLFRNWEVVTNAAREGARIGVLPDYVCDEQPRPDVTDRVGAYMAASGITSNFTVDVAHDGDSRAAAGTFNACVVSVAAGTTVANAQRDRLADRRIVRQHRRPRQCRDAH